MMHLVANVLEALRAASWAPGLASLLLKGAVVLAAAVFLGAVLNAASGRLRHALLSVALLGVLALPLLPRLLPAWGIALGPLRAALGLQTPARTDPAPARLPANVGTLEAGTEPLKA